MRPDAVAVWEDPEVRRRLFWYQRVMTGHVECCTEPILNFIAETVGERILVNVMAQYYPANLVARTPEKYPDIARRLSREEIQRAYAYARALNLQFEQVS